MSQREELSESCFNGFRIENSWIHNWLVNKLIIFYHLIEFKFL